MPFDPVFSKKDIFLKIPIINKFRNSKIYIFFGNLKIEKRSKIFGIFLHFSNHHFGGFWFFPLISVLFNHVFFKFQSINSKFQSLSNSSNICSEFTICYNLHLQNTSHFKLYWDKYLNFLVSGTLCSITSQFSC